MGRAPARFENRCEVSPREDALLSIDLRDAIENPDQFADLLETEASPRSDRLRSKLAVILFLATCTWLLIGAVFMGIVYLM